MQLKLIVVAACQAVAVLAMERRGETVLTATKIYHTIVDQSPFLVDVTSTVAWTESASIPDTSLPTEAPVPTINY